MTPLITIDFPSIYTVRGVRTLLPERMARCAPDTKACLLNAANSVRDAGGQILLSDLFRSYEMQLGSHNDFRSGKKKAFSPPPGGSLHEAGRAFDLDLDALAMPLRSFWEICTACELTPIIDKPDPRKSEAWHFECRGSHSLVYGYYKRGQGNNFETPYQAMAASAIVSSGIRHDKFAGREKNAYVQSALIRLGHVIGNLDGWIGKRTRDALDTLGLGGSSLDEIIDGLDDLLQTAFPHEFFENVTPSFTPAPLGGGGGSADRDDSAIAVAAGSSPVARYRWKDRGRAPLGYTKGMAVAFAETIRRLRGGDPAAKAMAAPLMGDPAKDALNWYSSELTSVGAKLGAAAEDRLIALFTLLLGLGLRESSGRHCEGRDLSADNTGANNAEAGLFQVSFDSVGAAPELKQLFEEFRDREDLLDIFDEGVSCGVNAWRNWGTGEGERFQALTKRCPLFAVLYAGVLARVNRKHWGPINRKQAEVLPEAVTMFRNVQAFIPGN